MKNMINYVVLILILSGCGPRDGFKVKSQIISTNEQFVQYVVRYKDFKEEYLGSRAADYNIYISFANLESPILGQCRKSSDPLADRYIMVDISEWDTSPDSLREQLIFHELGHCDLDLDNKSGSIMSTYQLSQYYYETYHDELVRDLFLGDGNFLQKMKIIPKGFEMYTDKRYE